MAFRSHPIILFLDKSGFYIYQDILPNVLKFNFTPDVVVNSDVVDKDKLKNLVTAFVQTNKIAPSSLAIVLSDDVIYMKEIPACAPKVTPEQKSKDNSEEESKPCKNETQEFLSNIPFENVIAKLIKSDKMSQAIGTNKDLVMTIADGFAEKGSSLEIVIPAFVYGRNANFSTGLNSNNVKAILENTEALKINNMLMDQKVIILPQDVPGSLMGSTSNSEPVKNPNSKKRNIREFILIGVFIFLLIVLVIVFFVSRGSEAPTSNVKKNIPAKALLPTASPIDNSMATPSAAASTSANLENIKIIIDYPAGSTTQTVLNKQLSELGFKNVISQISQTSIQGKSSIVFSQNISVDTRTKIVNEVREVLPNVSILESQDASSTAKISIGKS